MNLKNQRIVILGGTSGIGLAVAQAAAAEEANVIIASSKPDRVAGALNMLTAFLRRAEDGTLSRVLVEASVLLTASRGNYVWHG